MRFRSMTVTARRSERRVKWLRIPACCFRTAMSSASAAHIAVAQSLASKNADWPDSARLSYHARVFGSHRGLAVGIAGISWRLDLPCVTGPVSANEP